MAAAAPHPPSYLFSCDFARRRWRIMIHDRMMLVHRAHSIPFHSIPSHCIHRPPSFCLTDRETNRGRRRRRRVSLIGDDLYSLRICHVTKEPAASLPHCYDYCRDALEEPAPWLPLAAAGMSSRNLGTILFTLHAQYDSLFEPSFHCHFLISYFTRPRT